MSRSRRSLWRLTRSVATATISICVLLAGLLGTAHAASLVVAVLDDPRSGPLVVPQLTTALQHSGLPADEASTAARALVSDPGMRQALAAAARDGNGSALVPAAARVLSGGDARVDGALTASLAVSMDAVFVTPRTPQMRAILWLDANGHLAVLAGSALSLLGLALSLPGRSCARTLRQAGWWALTTGALPLAAVWVAGPIVARHLGGAAPLALVASQHVLTPSEPLLGTLAAAGAAAVVAGAALPRLLGRRSRVAAKVALAA